MNITESVRRFFGRLNKPDDHKHPEVETPKQSALLTTPITDRMIADRLFEVSKEFFLSTNCFTYVGACAVYAPTAPGGGPRSFVVSIDGYPSFSADTLEEAMNSATIEFNQLRRQSQ